MLPRNAIAWRNTTSSWSWKRGLREARKSVVVKMWFASAVKCKGDACERVTLSSIWGLCRVVKSDEIRNQEDVTIRGCYVTSLGWRSTATTWNFWKLIRVGWSFSALRPATSGVADFWKGKTSVLKGQVFRFQDQGCKKLVDIVRIYIVQMKHPKGEKILWFKSCGIYRL